MNMAFVNIFDLFDLARARNLCTKYLCTTCGAMDFRRLCGELGPKRLSAMIAAVTEEMLDTHRVDEWYEPLRTILGDFGAIDRDCPMMRRFEKGWDWLTMQHEKMLWENGQRQVRGITGSVFDENAVDGLALFRPVACSALAADIPGFVGKFGEVVHGSMIDVTGGCGGLKWLYYGDRLSESCCSKSEIERLIAKALDELSSRGCRSVSMNGIRSKGHSERDNLDCVVRWFVRNTESSIKMVRLVDKRGGFVRMKIVESRLSHDA